MVQCHVVLFPTHTTHPPMRCLTTATPFSAADVTPHRGTEVAALQQKQHYITFSFLFFFSFFSLLLLLFI